MTIPARAVNVPTLGLHVLIIMHFHVYVTRDIVYVDAMLKRSFMFCCCTHNMHVEDIDLNVQAGL